MLITSLPIELLEKILDNNLIMQLNLILSSKFMNNFKIKKNYENKFKFNCDLINFKASSNDINFWKIIDSYKDNIYCWHDYIPAPIFVSCIPNLDNIKINLVEYERPYSYDKKSGIIIKIINKNNNKNFWKHSISGLSTNKINWKTV